MAKKKLTEAQKADYRRAVNRINKQLYRLEQHYAETGEDITKTAYVSVMRDIKSFFGEGKKRFSKVIPDGIRKYQKIMNAIKRFYEKPSSTISGMANVYSKRAKTWSKKMNADITADDMKDIFESGLYRELANHYGSATVLKKIGMIERQAERIKELVKQKKKIYFLGSGAKELNDDLAEDIALDSVLRRYYEGATQ